MSVLSAVQVEIGYRYLEPKPYKRGTKQLGLKGRNMLASTLVAVMRVNGFTASEVARDYELPVEAVEEALAYFEANEEWIRAENRAAARRAGLEP